MKLADISENVESWKGFEMAVTVIERSGKSKIVHVGNGISTVDMTNAPTGHNFVNITNLSANRVAFTLDGSTPSVPTTDNPSSFGEGFFVPENSVNGGIRSQKYQNSEFSSLKIAAAASGTRVIVEVCTVGPVLTTR